MKRTLKSALSILLVLSLIFSLVPAAFAADYDDESGASYFDFDAAEYIVDEDAGELKVKIVRFGGTDSEVDVSFKVADFLSDYGYDYEVLDEYGDALDKVYGEKPEYSELVNEDEESSDEEEYSDEDRSGADEYIEDEYVDEEYYDDEEEEDEYLDEEESFVEEDEYSDEEDIYTENSFVDEDIVNEDKKEISTGSSLLDAQAEFLDLPLDTAENYEEEAFNETLNDMYNYFLVAQGASGVVHFGEGEKEKEITIKIFDNDDAESDKIFMLALMSTSTDDTSLAPNATTYVNILDDEDFRFATRTCGW